MADKEEVNRVARKFEKIYGTEALLKVSFSSFAKLLVEKGVITEEDILDSFIEEVSEAFIKLKDEADSE